MMQTICCPACQTTFRVSPEQLHAHDGIVRCGQCFLAFDASDPHAQPQTNAPWRSTPDLPPMEEWTLADEGNPLTAVLTAPRQAPPAFPLTQDRAAPLSDTETSPNTPLPPTQPQLASPTPEAPLSLPFIRRTKVYEQRQPVPTIPSSRYTGNNLPLTFPTNLIHSAGTPPALSLSSLPSTPQGTIAHEEPFPLPNTNDTTSPFLAPEDLPQPPTDDTRLSNDDPTNDEGEAYGEGAPPPTHSETQQGTSPSLLSPPSADTTTLSHTDAQEASLPWPASVSPIRPSLEHLLRQTRPQADNPLYRHPRTLAAALGLFLLIQLVFLSRTDFALHFPGLCQKLGCTVSLPRNPEQIGITSSDLQLDPKHANQFILNAVLQNRDRRPQQYPHLELTLTNDRDQPIVRRVLAPAEWLPHTNVIQPESAGFAANSKLSLRLNFAVRDGEDAIGYRLYTFYP